MSTETLRAGARRFSLRRLGGVASVLLAATAGCSTTTSSKGTPGGSGSSGDDNGGSTALGFEPSNLGDALDALDVSALTDIDVSEPQSQPSPSCATGGTAGCVALSVTQSDGSTVQVFFARSWTIEATAVLSVTGKTPAVLVALDTITVLGQIDASADGLNAVGGGFTATDDGTAGGPGQGSPGLNGDSTSYGAGAGGAGFCGAGGAGGQADPTYGGGGGAYGSPELVPLLGGSAGGKGDLFAGAGGGAIELVAGTSITIGSSGIISAGGGGAADGDTIHGANGGGSGGAILIEAPSVTVAGVLEVNGGAGGGGTGAPTTAPDATADTVAAPGGAPGTTGAGGDGSAGATVTGGDGGDGDPYGGTYAPGGGGGGAGYIRINTMSGVASITGTLSPALASACVSQGVLAD